MSSYIILLFHIIKIGVTKTKMNFHFMENEKTNFCNIHHLLIRLVSKVIQPPNWQTQLDMYHNNRKTIHLIFILLEMHLWWVQGYNQIRKLTCTMSSAWDSKTILAFFTDIELAVSVTEASKPATYKYFIDR